MNEIILYLLIPKKYICMIMMTRRNKRGGEWNKTGKYNHKNVMTNEKIYRLLYVDKGKEKKYNRISMVTFYQYVNLPRAW